MSSPVNAFIDPETGLRRYRWREPKATENLILTSVTSMRRVVGMPMPLAAWSENQIIDALLEDERGELLARALNTSVSRRRGEGDRDYWDRVRKAQRRPIRAAAMAERDRAADLGTAVHEAAENGLRSHGMSDLDERKAFLLQLEAFNDRMKPTEYLSEVQIFNLREGYAGTADSFLEVDDKMTLVDYKTGKGVYNDHAIQLSLYAHGDFIGAYDPITDRDVVDERATAVLKAVQQMAVLHLRPDGWEWIVIPDTDELAAAALDMVRFARWLERHPTLERVAGPMIHGGTR